MRTPKTPRLTQPNLRRTLIAAALSTTLFQSARADYEAEILSENPVVYYRFNDAVTVDDQPTPELNLGSLGAVGNGGLSGSLVRQATGALTGSADFSSNTVGNGLTIPYTAALNHQGSFSVEVWLKPSSADIPALNCAISSWRENTDTFGREGWLIYQGAAGTGFNFRTYNKNGANIAASISSGAGVSAGAWHHVVATWDNVASVARIYVNGVLKSTSAVIAPGGVNNRAFEANTSSGFTVGSRSDNAFGWTGGIDEPAYYAGTVLSDAQVLAHYNNGISPTPSPSYNTAILADAPVGYWRMNNTWTPRTPPAAFNAGSLGASANGAYYAGSKNATGGPSPSSGFLGFGATNSSLGLATANGHVGTPFNLNALTNYTVMGWVKRGALKSTRGGYFGQNDKLEFGDAGGGTQIEAWSGGGQVLAPYAAADDQWVFIAYVADGSNNRLYVDGIQAASAAGGVGGSSAFNFNIGGGGVFAPTGDYFRGEIDEVAIFNKAVTPGRVKQLHDAALGNVGPGLVELYPSVTPLGEVPEGQPYTLSIDPTGTPPFTYQWKLNGVDIPLATGRTYTVPSAAAHSPNPLDPYSYTVVVNNGTNTPVTSDATDVYVTPTLKWTSTAATNAGKWNIDVLSPNPLNWKTFTGGTATAYTDDYAVQFDDSAAASAVALTQDVTPKGIAFDNTAKDYTLTGPYIISSPIGGGAIKNGTGKVVLANDIFNMDALTVNAGTLQVGDGTNGTMSVVTAVKVMGGQLVINQGSGTIYESPTTLTGGPISFIGSGDLSVAPQGTSSISGPGNELFNRNGTTVVSGSNLVGGTVTINTGTVAFDGNQQANRLPAGKVVTVNPGATMEVRGVNALPTGVNGVSPVLTQATLNVVSGNSAAQSGGSHAHLGNITLDGSQVFLSYSGAGGVYSGESFQLNGNLTVTGSTASTIGYGTGGNAGNAGIAPSADVTHTVTVPNVAVGPDLTISAELENTDSGTPATAILAKTGPGTLRLADGISHSFSGTTQINQGTLEATGSLAGPLAIASGATLAPGTTTSVATFGAAGITLGGVLDCNIAGAVADKIAVTGNVVLNAGAQISFNVLGGVTEPIYEIISCTGTITGPLPSASGIPVGFSLAQMSNSIVLIQNGFSFQPVLTKVPGSVSTGLVSENFDATNGGFTVNPVISPEADWTYSAGSWKNGGQNSAFGGDNTSFLVSPPITLTKSGVVSLSFSHRYSFEADYDGGAVDVSLNGGPFTRVSTVSFSQNPYNGALGGVDHSLRNGEAFVGNSTGHPAFITSVCKVTAGLPGDTVQVRFVSGTDNNTVGNLTPAGWEIDSLQVSEGGPGGALLDWPSGTMQYSDTLQAPWTDITGQGPVFIDTTLAPKRFFRLKP